MANASDEDKTFWAEIKLTPPEELNEKLTLARSSLQSLRDLVSANTELDVPKDDDDFLMRFLRAYDYDHIQAYQLVQHYFQIRAENHPVFGTFVPSKALLRFPKKLAGISPRLDPKGRLILIVGTGLWNPPSQTSLDFIRMCIMSLENCSFRQEAQVTGIAAVMDTKGWNVSKLTHLPLAHVRIILKLLQEYIPLKITDIYIINDMAVVHLIYRMARIFVHPELDKKMHFLGCNKEALFKHIPPECLPSDYGGVLEPLNTEEFLADMNSHEEQFNTLLNSGYAESPKKSKK